MIQYIKEQLYGYYKSIKDMKKRELVAQVINLGAPTCWAARRAVVQWASPRTRRWAWLCAG